MRGVAESMGWKSADWLSDVWLDGTRTCLEIVDRHVSRGARVLDYGCGVGFLSFLLYRMGYSVTGIDIDIGGNPEDAEEAYSAPWGTCLLESLNPGFIRQSWLRCPGDVDLISFNGREIPFGDASNDAVIAHAVVEHVEPEILGAVVRETRRVLRAGGKLFILRTPRKGSYLEKLFHIPALEKYAHEILYNESELTDLVAREGFILREKQVTDMFPAFPPRGIRVYNAISPMLIFLDHLLLRTPLRRYAHHMALVFEKTEGPID